jgi:hypothetical protein
MKARSISGRPVRSGTRISDRSGAQLVPTARSIHFSALPMAIDESIDSVNNSSVSNRRIADLLSDLISEQIDIASHRA